MNAGIFCPRCSSPDVPVQRTKRRHGDILRYHVCQSCQHHFATVQRVVADADGKTGTLLASSVTEIISVLRSHGILIGGELILPAK